MTEGKHTPGPWQVSGARHKIGGEQWHTIGPDGKWIAAVIYSDRTIADHVTSLADARLIAAAPALLEALKLAQEELRLIRMKDCATTYHPGLDVQIYLAIAKAEGRQP